MSEWRRTKLGDCADWLSGGTPFKGNPAFWSGTIPWVSAKDMKSFCLHDAEDHIAADAGGKLVPSGTVLMLVRGMTLHNDVPICVTMCEMAFNQDIKAICAKPGLEHQFLAYWLLAHKPALLSAVDHAGHGTGRLLTDLLKQMPVDLPSLSEQRAISSVLGALDDKIELNRRMNETLEALARALFQNWFVEATQAGLPKGWREVPLPEAIEVNPSRPLRKGEVAPYLDMANMPTRAARAMEVYDREFGSGMRFLDGDTLVARITPCLENGKTCFVDFLGDGKVGWGSTEYVVLCPKPPLPPEYAYFLARTESFRAFAISNMTGTSGRQRVPADSLNNFTVVVPPAQTAERFGQFARGVFAQLKAHDDESRTLAALRDALLPKLLSGELRLPSQGFGTAGVPAAAKIVEAHA